MPEPVITLEIDGQRLAGWIEAGVTRAIDSVSTATFRAPFDPNSSEQRELFRPFSFREVKVKADDETIFTGIAAKHTPDGDPAQTTVSVSCYSKAGILEDVTAPPDLRPLEFNGLKLDKIAKALCAPFDLTPEFTADIGAKFDKTKIEPDENILGYLVELAKQRGLVIGDNADGQPVFRKSASPDGKVPVFSVGPDDTRPLVDVTSRTDSQQLYSKITCITKTKTGKIGGKFSASPLFDVGGVQRTLTFTADDTEAADAQAAAKARVGRDVASAATYTLGRIPSSLDSNGKLFEPDTFVSIEYPRRMIYGRTLFLVRSVSLSVNATSRTTTLEVTLPGVFSGDVLQAVPWEE